MRVRSASGFTMIEMVATMVVMGILSISVTGFITRSMEAHMATNKRTLMVNDGRFLVERISRELRRALPGSVRVASSGGNQCVEFVPIVAASTYKKDDLPLTSGTPSASFKVVDFTFTSSAGHFVAVYTTTPALVYDASLGARKALNNVGPVGGTNFRTVVLSGAHQFPDESPTRRMYIVKDPVSFCSVGNRIYRYSGYAYATTQPVTPAGGVLLAEGLDQSIDPFTFAGATLTRNAMVVLDLKFTTDGETVRFSREVHLRNAT